MLTLLTLLTRPVYIIHGRHPPDMDSTSGNSRPARRVRHGPTTGFVPLPPSQYFRQSGTTERLPARRLAGPSLFVPSTLYIHRPT